MKILINKEELLKSITYTVDDTIGDYEDFLLEDAINLLTKVDSIVRKLPNNLTLGTLSKVMEEALE